jgi:hypothetical protein
MNELNLWQKLMLYIESYKQNRDLRGYGEYDPKTALDEYNIPKSRREILRWSRIYFSIDPTVQNIVEENALEAIPLFTLSTSSKKITEFYNDMAFNAKFNLYDFMKLFSLSYHKFGESIPFGNMEEGKDGKWRWHSFILIEPELVEVKQDMLTGARTFELIPTVELREAAKDLVKSRDLSSELVKGVAENRNIRLDESAVSLVARLTDPSATRGTSPIQCVFKVLASMDRMRLLKTGSDRDWDYCKKQLSLGLKLSDLHLRSRRDTFENWMLNNYFKPIAEKNNFRSKGKLILPKITWQTK